MTNARLIEDGKGGFRKRFIVEIDLTSHLDSDVERMVKELRGVSWDFADDLADIIERKE